MTTRRLSDSWAGRILAFCLAIVVLLIGSTEAQTTKNMTWDNAPPPAHKLFLSEEEFRELFPERLRRDAGFCPVPCIHNVNGKRPDGRPFVQGHWETDRKTGKTDYQYRPGRSTLEKGKPYFCHVTAYYRYALPDAEQPRPVEDNRPYRRLDMTTFASVNAPYTAQAIREWKARDAKQYGEKVKDTKHRYYKYRYVADLGFGLDRNDMFSVLSTNGKSCEVHIQLNSSKHWFYARLFLHMEDGAVSQERALAVARNAAAILAKKGFGANVTLERDKEAGAVGLLDGWIADNLGKMPEEDRRLDRVQLGKKFHIVCAYKLPPDLDEICIGFEKNPGQDAVAASRERSTRVKEDSVWWKPLNPSGYKALDIGLIYSSREKHDADGTRVKVRKTADGSLVVSFLVDTADPQEPFIVGPGAWDFLVRMTAIKRGATPMDSDHEVEVSTHKVSVKIVDNEAFSSRVLKPREKASADRARPADRP